MAADDVIPLEGHKQFCSADGDAADDADEDAADAAAGDDTEEDARCRAVVSTVLPRWQS